MVSLRRSHRFRSLGSRPGLTAVLAVAGLSFSVAAFAASGNPVPDPPAGEDPAGARAISVADALFVVTLDNDQETEKAFSYESDQVPFLPGQSCYGWRLRLSDGMKVVRFKEVLNAPSDPAFWPHEPSEFDTTAKFRDRTVTVTERTIMPEEGWIGNGWCVLEGDPKGAYSVEVSVNGQFARRFDFEVRDMPGLKRP